MRLAPKLAVVVVMAFALSACAPSTPATPSATSEPVASAPPKTAPSEEVTECPPTPIDVTITYELVVDASGGITIDAASNLPDGAALGASFFVEGGYFAQDEGTLEDGKVSFGPFSDKGTPLKGTYEMSITLPIARNQPDSVQACIGSAGELLTGPLVSAEEITGDNVASLDVIVTVE
ncbi:hypothetical protein [Microbacterium sp. zg-YB36]|uniref:hypothetical protein n=1 Tax=Microbacterium sp. zg-YB36 TaxID=2969407 RepID=UPI00214BDE3B|nr:hypothetical protein [Microbacterium sp. zg-YB36]MDL5351579.1 hypothetical protein [Microbacterium sp. zg-YB36]